MCCFEGKRRHTTREFGSLLFYKRSCRRPLSSHGRSPSCLAHLFGEALPFNWLVLRVFLCVLSSGSSSPVRATPWRVLKSPILDQIDASRHPSFDAFGSLAAASLVLRRFPFGCGGLGLFSGAFGVFPGA